MRRQNIIDMIVPFIVQIYPVYTFRICILLLSFLKTTGKTCRAENFKVTHFLSKESERKKKKGIDADNTDDDDDDDGKNTSKSCFNKEHGLFFRFNDIFQHCHQ